MSASTQFRPIDPVPLGARRRLLLGGLVIGLLVVVVGWGLPNIAGFMFVDVQAVVTADGDPGGVPVLIGAQPAVNARSIQIVAQIHNSYPLPVVLGSGTSAFQSEVFQRRPDGTLTRVWQTTAADPSVEEGSDSPMGGDGSQIATLVPSGTSSYQITDSTTRLELVDSAGRPLLSGQYFVRVWAYGIGSPLVPVDVGAGE